MKAKTVKTILIICASVLLFAGLSYYIIFIHGVYAESNKVVGEYVGTAHISPFENDEEWEIGANKYGEPVFTNPKKAFQLASERFTDAIDLIYDEFEAEYHIGRFSEKNFQMYKQLGWQIPTDNEAVRKQGVQLSQFLDIYENSSKRWIYEPGNGWERICPN